MTSPKAPLRMIANMQIGLLRAKTNEAIESPSARNSRPYSLYPFVQLGAKNRQIQNTFTSPEITDHEAANTSKTHFQMHPSISNSL